MRMIAFLTDDGVYASQLLEDLDRTGSQEPSSGPNPIILDEILPLSTTYLTIPSRCRHNVFVQSNDLRLRHLTTAESLQDFERLVWSIMSRKPAWCLGYEEQQYYHGEEEDALQDARNPPGIAGGRVIEAKVNPVYQRRAEVEGCELHAYD